MNELNTFHQFFFGIYPYICLAVFFFGSLMRFDREQYTWKSDSSEMLYRGQLRLGSVLFHVGVLAVFGGHLFGLLTPLWFWDAIGVTHSAKQVFAMTMGGIFGTTALVGLIILINRRFKVDRISINSTWRDKLVLIWILITLLLGLSTIVVSMGHLDGHGNAPGIRHVADHRQYQNRGAGRRRKNVPCRSERPEPLEYRVGVRR